jgi:hypothetical protein
MIQLCQYCLRPIDTRGMPGHVHFKHRSQVAREFSLNPVVWGFLWAHEQFLPPDLSTRALPATTLASVTQTMLSPFEKMPRWI